MKNSRGCKILQFDNVSKAEKGLNRVGEVSSEKLVQKQFLASISEW